MPFTIDKVMEETSQVAELVDRLTSTLLPEVDVEIDATWKKETLRRLAELENGTVQAIPGNVFAARVRKIVGGK